MENQPEVLLVECADRPGLVHGITGVLLRAGVNIVSNHEFVDGEHGRFYMRTAFEGACDGAALRAGVEAALPAGALVALRRPGRERLVVLASREHHCLADLLVRHGYAELGAELVAVVSNHEQLRPLADKFGVPFHLVSHEGRTREAHEAALGKILAPLQPDYLVLAKYMRVLSPEFVAAWPRRIINIHHSFLPAFVGARPYQQAFVRGVKVIGATAHFVTEQIDEGPIIVQRVIPVDHSHTARDLAQAGREVERDVLARALKLVLESRVFLNRNRTIIFD
jgi:formyltetrahydrofolate deformylase